MMPLFSSQEDRWSLVSRLGVIESRTFAAEEGNDRQFFSLTEKGIFREELGGDKAEFMMPLFSSQEDRWSLVSRLGVIESRTFAAEDRILNRSAPIRWTYFVMSTSEEVNVPAGRFKNCLKVRGTGITTVKVNRRNSVAEVKVDSVDWYVPGVGLIKVERTEHSDSTFLKPGFYALELLKTHQRIKINPE